MYCQIVCLNINEDDFKEIENEIVVADIDKRGIKKYYRK